MAAKKKGVSKSSPKKKAKTRNGMTIVDVARHIGIKYQRARDLMLEGHCGPTEYDGRTLICTDPLQVDACKNRITGMGQPVT